jgi:chromosomal replication initiation ATPase DnaA
MKELIEFIEYLDKQGIRLQPDILSGFIKLKAKQKTLTDKITELICSYYHTHLGLIRFGGRKRHFVEPKQVISYFLIKTANITTEKIGIILNCDHSTVTYSNKVVKNMIETDYNFAEKINKIETLIETL